MTRANFSSLFQSAVKEWPEAVNLADIQYQSGDRYTVGGLGKLLEQVESPHIGSKDEVVLREMHWSIFTLIHLLAKDVQELKPSSIRAEAVQQIFIRRLQTAVASKDSRWSVEDFELAQAYLRNGGS